MERLVAYVDGFNLYYGMKGRGWQRYYWLNIQLLIQNLLKPDQQLVCTKYFTSRVSSTPGDPQKDKRQGTYLEALETLSDFQVFYGHYLGTEVRCFNCGHTWSSHEEKMTDVNIAVELMVDAFQDTFDTALVVSGDSDLSRPIEAVPRLFPGKRLVVAFPPGRSSAQLKRVAGAWLPVGRRKLAASQFPDQVEKADGRILQKPSAWK